MSRGGGTLELLGVLVVLETHPQRPHTHKGGSQRKRAEAGAGASANGRGWT